MGVEGVDELHLSITSLDGIARDECHSYPHLENVVCHPYVVAVVEVPVEAGALSDDSESIVDLVTEDDGENDGHGASATAHVDGAEGLDRGC
ncbi:hypothetical protein COCNU_scaffold000539G000020 [Cocos nucifera]|nr:hypothetical protein [Cocos nucifera]